MGGLAARAETILVLPFPNLSSQAPDLDWISESISENIRQSLYGRDLLVVGREDRQEVYRRLTLRPQARLTRASVIKIAQDLDATAVVYGEFELIPSEPAPAQPAASRGSLRITFRILDMKRMAQPPDQQVTGALEDLSRLQTHLSWQALRDLAPESAPPEEEFRKERPLVRLDALENYIRGLMADNYEQQHRYFTQASRLDQEFADPIFHLGRVYVQRKEYRLALSWLGRIKPNFPSYREALFLLGLSKFYTSDYQGAQAAFEQVAAAIPLNEVFNDLGAAQSRRNLPQALENFEKALEGDPSDPDYQFNAGYALWKQGRFADAAERFRAALDRKPDDAMSTLLLGKSLKQAGPRPNDPSTQGLERVKLNYEERAYWELKAALGGKK